MLLKRQQDPKAFARMNMLMDHVEARSETSGSQATQQLFKLVLLLREESSRQDFTYKEVHKTKDSVLFVALNFCFRFRE